MASTCYRYTPLSSTSSLRLLRLKSPLSAQRPNEPIEIELFETSFENAPTFEAVSYAWDHASTFTTLVCNGQHLHVSPVVSEMVFALSCVSTTGVFWIDAVCIDQSSATDKNIQVPRMRLIFSEARKVWIWLGKGSFESTVAFRFLIEMYSYSCGQQVEPTNTMLAKKWWNSLRTYQDTIREARGVYDAVDTDFIIDVIRSPWFHRTWTIQEVALARSATLVCGGITLEWSSFLDILKRLQQSLSDQPTHGVGMKQHLISNPATFFDDIRTYSTMTEVVLHHKPLPLSRALDLVRHNHSTDPKDKVYGLFGIFDYLEIKDLPQVDYTCSVQRLYYEMTRTIFRNDGQLLVLYLTALPSHVSDLPTWIPDYSNTEYIRYIDANEHRASKRSCAEFSFGLSDLSLSVSGVLLDEIDLQASSTSICTPDFRQGFAARSNLSSTKERYTAVTELIRTLQSWVDVSRRVECYPTGEEPSTAFYKIMTQPLRSGSQNWPMPTTSRTTKDIFEWWLSIVTTNLSEDPSRFHLDITKIESDSNSAAIVNDYIRLFGCSQDPRDWSAELQIRLLLRARDQALSTLQHDISLLSYQRTFFTTSAGYMGVGPRWAQPSDRIALIAGLQLPFILRKAGDKFNLVGPAYIHGIMQGERWDGDSAEKITLI
ncbi:heterokaryon incompatibility protein-domain-containing protein [Boeremia exigua]|uniref:heterokaryon incompatibility protein-domain-containing protein n=1 Tax=Boeremia exigua TaxID=749465 RepID=UPI001E8DD9E4|nr:heterokaryon incompatibility protein-domain-containing protein [Boeremia exigua]KAH6644410.1 heterokaryon incompatibility protein-domain-containing protein [Boeremia exigua]